MGWQVVSGYGYDLPTLGKNTGERTLMMSSDYAHPYLSTTGPDNPTRWPSSFQCVVPVEPLVRLVDPLPPLALRFRSFPVHHGLPAFPLGDVRFGIHWQPNPP